MLCEGNTMHDMNLEKNRSKIQTAYKVSPFTKGTCPEPEDAVKRFESRYTPIPAEYRWLLLNFGGCYLDRKSTRLNSSHLNESRMPSSA